MGFTGRMGIDFVLPAPPPLVLPPLSLLDSATKLLDTEGLVERLRVVNEKAASAAQLLSDLVGGDEDEGGPPMGAADSVEDAKRFLTQMDLEASDDIGSLIDGMKQANVRLMQFASDLAGSVADLSRWENGFVYLPELSNDSGLEVFVPGSYPAEANPTVTSIKNTGSNQAPAQNPFYWYDPFIVVARDERSLFGWPNTDFESRAQRAQRALRGHESWQVEQEFWCGEDCPTNYHLSASPNTPTTSPHRTIDPWPNPTPAPGTNLGTAYGLGQSLAALDQAIAESEAGTGMIHATPYVMQEWMRVYPFIRDPNLAGVYTVNHNLMLPGFGYGGTGPDQASRSLTDGSGATGSYSFVSATADFTTNDIGRLITETSSYGVIPAGTYINAVLSSTNVLLSQEMASTHGSIHFTIAGLGGRAMGGPQQWAYATEQVYTCRGDVTTYPYDLREGSPLVPVDDSIDVRAERTWATITNRLLRAAVLVDTTIT
jgi:hypothetical protein